MTRVTRGICDDNTRDITQEAALPDSACLPMPDVCSWRQGGGKTQPQLSSGSESRRHNQRAQSDLGLGTRRECDHVLLK